MTIDLFPETGHHYIFLPFADDPEGDELPSSHFLISNLPKGIDNLCYSDQDSWHVYVNQETQITEEWVRWRYSFREIEKDGFKEAKPGILVRVETNLGERDRGSVLQQRTELPPQELESPEVDSPYYRKAIEDVPDIKQTEILPFFAHGGGSGGGSGGMFAPTSESVTPLGHGDENSSIGNSPQRDCGEPELGQPNNAPSGMIRIQELHIWWAEPTNVGNLNSAGEWEVDIIVDFGNSRSVALVLERPKLAAGMVQPKLSSLVEPVRIMGRGQGYERADRAHKGDPLAIFDSWFLLHEPQFADFLPPEMAPSEAMVEQHIEDRDPSTMGEKKRFRVPIGRRKKEPRPYLVGETKRVPQMFVEVAPCVVGQEAKDVFASVNFEQGRSVYLSSPKRYLWDTDPYSPQQWGMLKNLWNSKAMRMTPKLQGYVLNFLPEKPEVNDDLLEDWAIDKPPILCSDPALRPSTEPVAPNYPRCDSMVWMALSILETAYRQLNSRAYAKQSFGFIQKKLSSVCVTFPPGWTGQEKRLYRRKWLTAIRIFSHTHFADPEKEVPNLRMDTDEGLAAQIPIVFGEIERMGAIGENWLQLIGKMDPRGFPAARIMTIDIGGGTTDYSIVDYTDLLPGPQKNLDCNLLFRDSSGVAGDELVKAIIDNILLPSIGSRFKGSQDQMEHFEALFTSEKPVGTEQEAWKRIVRMVLIPKVNQWLSNWGDGADPDLKNEDKFGRSIMDDIVVTQLNEFAKREGITADIIDREIPIDYTNDQLAAQAEEVFTPLFQSLSKLITIFGVDMVVLTGKPSEAPAVRQLIEEILPIMPSRIITAKNHPIGDWYPFSWRGEIYDAKTVTATGVALCRALDRGLIPGWVGIQRRASVDLMRKNCWIEVLERGMPKNQATVYLKNGVVDECQEESGLQYLTINTRIGRSLLPTQRSPEPVYKLQWRKPEWTERYGVQVVRVNLERHLEKPEIPTDPESLRIKEASGSFIYVHDNGVEEEITYTTDDLFLKLCTLVEGQHWIDDARFSVNWD